MLRFTQVDVFSDRLWLGNPVAVVHDAGDVSPEQMAAFARWTNLSETTFLSPPTEPRADYRLRIFTPGRELSFAGHPTLGSARAWLEAGGIPRQHDRLVQQCGAGLVQLRRSGQRLAFAAPELVRGGPVDEDDLAPVLAGLRLPRREVVEAQWADNGPGWMALLLHDAQAVLAVDPDRHRLAAAANVGLVGPYPTGSPVQFEVRAFMSRTGAAEDPVTGSLNAAVAQWLIRTGRAPSSYTAAQGTRVGRRGRVHVEQDGDQVWVGGDTVLGVVGSVAL